MLKRAFPQSQPNMADLSRLRIEISKTETLARIQKALAHRKSDDHHVTLIRHLVV